MIRRSHGLDRTLRTPETTDVNWSRRLPSRAIPIVASLILAACTAGDDETSKQEPRQNSAAQSAEQQLEKQYDQQPPHSGAPEVENPVDITDSVEDICQVFDVRDLEEVGITVEAPEGSGGAYCDFEMDTPTGVSTTSPQMVTIASWDTLDQGISELYARAASDEFDEFEELPPIRSYPAVRHRLPGDGDESCDVTVGMNDRQSLTITYADGEQVYSDEPCSAAAEIAEMAVSNVLD